MSPPRPDRVWVVSVDSDYGHHLLCFDPPEPDTKGMRWEHSTWEFVPATELADAKTEIARLKSLLWSTDHLHCRVLRLESELDASRRLEMATHKAFETAAADAGRWKARALRWKRAAKAHSAGRDYVQWKRAWGMAKLWKRAAKKYRFDRGWWKDMTVRVWSETISERAASQAQKGVDRTRAMAKLWKSAAKEYRFNKNWWKDVAQGTLPAWGRACEMAKLWKRLAKRNLWRTRAYLIDGSKLVARLESKLEKANLALQEARQKHEEK